MQIKDLTIEEFKALIRETVEETLEDLLLDPDQDRPLKASIHHQLLQMKQRRLTQKQTLSSAQVMEELGLNS